MQQQCSSNTDFVVRTCNMLHDQVMLQRCESFRFIKCFFYFTMTAMRLIETVVKPWQKTHDMNKKIILFKPKYLCRRVYLHIMYNMKAEKAEPYSSKNNGCTENASGALPDGATDKYIAIV